MRTIGPDFDINEDYGFDFDKLSGTNEDGFSFNDARVTQMVLDEMGGMFGISSSTSATRGSGLLGRQYQGARDMYTALGYERTLAFSNYIEVYERQDIARRVVKAPVEASWKNDPRVFEPDTPADESGFEKTWKELVGDKELQVFDNLRQGDLLAGIGCYGAIYLGFDDVHAEDDLSSEVANGSKLLFMTPLTENSAQIKSYNGNKMDARFGKPEQYSLQFFTGAVKGAGTRTPQQGTIKTGSTVTSSVHWSRVIHIAEDPLENKAVGTPRLQAVFNRLMDMEKTVGAAAEAFWQQGFPGLAFITEKGKSPRKGQSKDALVEQIDDYINKMTRVLRLRGMKVQQLKAEVADPSKVFEVIVSLISSATGIPRRILTGSESGELASSQDEVNWGQRIEARRLQFVNPSILDQFVGRLVKVGILPTPTNGWAYIWPDLLTPSDKDRAEVNVKRVEALVKYADSINARFIIPVKVFLKDFMGYETEEEIDKILTEVEQGLIDDETDLDLEDDAILESGDGDDDEPGTAANLELARLLAHDPVDWAAVYEEGGAHWIGDMRPSKFAQIFAQMLVDEGKDTLLEIGSANGRDSILFALAGLEVTGIDLVPAAVEIAKGNAEVVEGVTIDFQEGDAEDLAFDDASFDSVFSLSVLHSTDLKKSIPEARRVLRANGVAFIYLYSNVERIDGSSKEFVSIDEYIDLVRASGFTIANIYTLPEEDFDEAGEKHLIIVSELRV